MGTVRKIETPFWDVDYALHVTDGGYVKLLSPLCYESARYLYEGMRTDIAFHWSQDLSCYKIDGVQVRP